MDGPPPVISKAAIETKAVAAAPRVKEGVLPGGGAVVVVPPVRVQMESSQREIPEVSSDHDSSRGSALWIVGGVVLSAFAGWLVYKYRRSLRRRGYLPLLAIFQSNNAPAGGEGVDRMPASHEEIGTIRVLLDQLIVHCFRFDHQLHSPIQHSDSDLSREAKQLQAQVESLTERFAAVQSKLDSLSSQNTELMASVQRLEEELAALKSYFRAVHPTLVDSGTASPQLKDFLRKPSDVSEHGSSHSASEAGAFEGWTQTEEPPHAARPPPPTLTAATSTTEKRGSTLKPLHFGVQTMSPERSAVPRAEVEATRSPLVSAGTQTPKQEGSSVDRKEDIGTPPRSDRRRRKQLQTAEQKMPEWFDTATIEDIRKRIIRLRTGASFKPQFRRFDKDGSGFLDRSEFLTFLRRLSLKLNPEEQRHVFQVLDADHDGTISYEEFEEFLACPQHRPESALSKYRQSLDAQLAETRKDRRRGSADSTASTPSAKSNDTP